jgi:ubiquinone/menaquinone biosynthesis C-methylase UbiE
MSDDAEARKAQTGALFSSLALDYDPVGIFAHFGRRLVAIVGIEDGQQVLDVASGRGAVLLPRRRARG